MRYFIILLFSITSLFANGFLKTQGTKIIDESGNEFILRGMGLGGWFLMEGYMNHTSSFANAEYQFREKIQALVGQQKTEEFFNKWWDNHVREIDVQKMAEWGFNSIRLPMHYNKLTNLNNDGTFYEEGFVRIDNLLSWCKKYNLYLILDLHGAPGGQSDEGISDYNPSKPSLWESETNKTITVNLWRKLAERYKDEPNIAGYDLINEPKWNLGNNNEQLKDLYVRITNAIREVDTKHILFIEGNWYATDFKGLTPAWDDNMVYSFHRYWNNNDLGTINYLLQIRNTYQVPLWLGETGENSNEWFKDCVNLMESNKIGWAWWPLKKISNVTGPLSAPMDNGFSKLLDYWNGRTTKPTIDYAYAALLQQAENMKFENCTYEPGVIDALFRQQKEITSIPYKDHSIPGTIFATDYNLGANGIAYNDVDNKNTTGSAGGQAWNNGGVYRNDGVDMEKCSDQLTNGFNIGWIQTGEWVKFTVTCVKSAVYNLSIRYTANDSNGRVLLTLNNKNLSDMITMNSTGGWQNWATKTIQDIWIDEGTYEFYARFFIGGFNINYFQFSPQITDVDETLENPVGFELMQNYPNPFNNQTVIKYNLGADSFVNLSVYDSMGQLVQVLENEQKEAGIYNVSFNSEKISSGVYFISLKTGNFSKTIKSILLN